MKQCYQEQRFYAKTRDLLDKIQVVVDEFMQRGIILTVRQLFYQMVSKGHIENTPRNYGKVQDAVNNGRMAGLIDWDAIEDRTRFERENAHWSSPDEILLSAVESYHIDKRLTQPVYFETWHTKIITMETVMGNTITMHGSANMRSSNSIEQVMIEVGARELHDFNVQIMEDIAERFGTINHKAPRHKLHRLEGREAWEVSNQWRAEAP